VTERRSASWQEARLRAELVAAGAAMARQGLVRGREGNLSCRLDHETVLATPSGWDKGRLTGRCLVRCRLSEAPPARASSEIVTHLVVYLALGDVGGIVHAHPPATLALASRGIAPNPRRLKEGEALIGKIEVVPALTPGSFELAEACALALGRAPAVVLADHGAFARGRDLTEALIRLETLELLARVTLEGGA
jgi:L-fuculose-phosphate aldolase